jgi:hypothetical protein
MTVHREHDVLGGTEYGTYPGSKFRFAIRGPRLLMDQLPAAPAPTASMVRSGSNPALQQTRGNG